MSNAPSDSEQLRKLEQALKEKPDSVQPPELLGFPKAQPGTPSMTRVAPVEEPQMPAAPAGAKVEFLDEGRQ